MFARLWRSVFIPTFVCSSSTDEFLLGVIYDWACFVLECFAWFLYLGFVSFICYCCSIVVSLYLSCTFFVWTIHLFSVLKTCWFVIIWLSFFVSLSYLTLFEDKQCVKLGRVDKCQNVVILYIHFVALIRSFVDILRINPPLFV